MQSMLQFAKQKDYETCIIQKKVYNESKIVGPKDHMYTNQEKNNVRR